MKRSALGSHLSRRPVFIAIQWSRQVEQRAMADLGRRAHRHARLDRIQPVAMLLGDLRADALRSGRSRWSRIFGSLACERIDLRAARVARRHRAAAGDEDPALVADELHAVGQVRRKSSSSRHWHNAHASRTAPWTSHRPLLGNSALPQTSTGPGMLHVHAPMGGVDMVRAPAGDHARAELLACAASRDGSRTNPAGGRGSRYSGISGVVPSQAS